jgi:hypothetical protein
MRAIDLFAFKQLCFDGGKFKGLPKEDLCIFKAGPVADPHSDPGAPVAKCDGRHQFTLSDNSVDRHGDMINTSGWKLDQFTKAGVVLWQHGKDAMIGNVPIAKPVRTFIDGDKLIGVCDFDLEDPYAAFIHGKVDRGFIKCASVGFRVLRAEPAMDRADKSDPWSMPMNLMENELLEWSPVAVPANGNALHDGPVKDAQDIAAMVEAVTHKCGGNCQHLHRPEADLGALIERAVQDALRAH